MSRTPALYALPLFSAAPTSELLPAAWLHDAPGDTGPALLGALLAVTRPDAVTGEPITVAFRPDQRHATWTAPGHMDGARCTTLGDLILHADADGHLCARDTHGSEPRRLPGGVMVAAHLPFLYGVDTAPVIVPAARTLTALGADGAPTWTWVASGDLHAVAYAEGVAYATTDAHLSAIDARTGQLLWSRALPGTGHAHLSARGAHVFAARDGGTVQAFTAAGQPLWARAPGGAPLAVLQAGADVVLVAADGSAHLTALDAFTGETRWVFTGETPCTSALLVGGTVYAACGRLHALCAASGRALALSGLFPHLPGHVSTPHLTHDPARQMLIAWASARPSARATAHAS
ncbi:PQQ-binding-like beta-propeller repeat protein [Deinococcus maricopensis]|uniref:Pyrrolo-quinoline quinone repeat-containing protein n=1 Tax=Deinococcus maricopensis (strain DSM 21211 / LMG 22137 / NRRL B-23946 / LB-34) TaxID=709986 RepID=E8U5H9_DEIML|nr:PQQ-binding-like beta-propeller repeat protein [Deinococcus maricopensis]ADV66318.1 Pyrrolo-quinoline quinone repeat-containing protein [Deinococcus maricopensis DSM 21211]